MHDFEESARKKGGLDTEGILREFDHMYKLRRNSMRKNGVHWMTWRLYMENMDDVGIASGISMYFRSRDFADVDLKL